MDHGEHTHTHTHAHIEREMMEVTAVPPLVRHVKT